MEIWWVSWYIDWKLFPPAILFVWKLTRSKTHIVSQCQGNGGRTIITERTAFVRWKKFQTIKNGGLTRMKQTPSLGSDRSREHTQANISNRCSSGTGSASIHPCPISRDPPMEEHALFPHITGAINEVHPRLDSGWGRSPICLQNECHKQFTDSRYVRRHILESKAQTAVLTNISFCSVGDDLKDRTGLPQCKNALWIWDIRQSGPDLSNCESIRVAFSRNSDWFRNCWGQALTDVYPIYSFPTVREVPVAPS